MTAQAGIYRDTWPAHWFGHFALVDPRRDTGWRRVLLDAVELADDQPQATAVFAFGAAGWAALDPRPDELPSQLRPLEPIRGADGRTMPATQEDLFVWVQGARPDHVLAYVLELRALLLPHATLARETIGHVHLDHRDLTGFEDGTANPVGDERPGVAQIPDGQPGAGGSYVLGQRWVHDLERWATLVVAEQEQVIGRTKATNLELDPHPVGSHLDRVVIEDADGEEEAIYRRSVPYGGYGEHGLYVLAFTGDLRIIDEMLHRMFGAAEDGRHDRLTDVTQPVSGAYYFAPTTELLRAVLSR